MLVREYSIEDLMILVLVRGFIWLGTMSLLAKLTVLQFRRSPGAMGTAADYLEGRDD